MTCGTASSTDLADDAHQGVRQGDQQVGGQVVGVVRRGDGGRPQIGVRQADRGQPAGRGHVVDGRPGQPIQHLLPAAPLRGIEPVPTLQLQRQQRHQVAGHLMGCRQLGGAVDQQPGP